MEQLITALLGSPLWLLLMAFGVPAFMLRRFEKKMDQREADRRAEQAEQERKAEEREHNREEMNRLQVRTTMAAIALGEATARAVQRIPDAHCNGDMHAALDYVKTVKREEKDFLTGLGIHALYED